MFLCTLGIMLAAPRAHPRPSHSAVMGCRTKTRERGMRCLLSLGSCRLASTAKPRSWNEQAPRAPAPRPPRAARARPRPPRGTARPRSMGPARETRPRQAPRARPRPPRGAARPPHILLPMFLGSHLLIFSQAAYATAAASAGIVASGSSAILRANSSSGAASAPEQTHSAIAAAMLGPGAESAPRLRDAHALQRRWDGGPFACAAASASSACAPSTSAGRSSASSISASDVSGVSPSYFFSSSIRDRSSIRWDCDR